MTAPETQMTAHEARRAGATNSKPVRVRGIIVVTDDPAAARDPLWAWPQYAAPTSAAWPSWSKSAVIILALWAAPANAGEMSRPNPHLTPGAVRTTSVAEVCARGYSRSHRVWHGKPSTLYKYGIPAGNAGEYEDDDLIPVCAGGDNASPLNHWPQPLMDAVIKDRDEAALCRLLCDRPSDERLSAVQQYFRSGEWAK